MDIEEADMDPVKVIKTVGGKTLNIYQDGGSANPRLDEDTRARMLFLHNRHQLGDSHSFQTPQQIDEFVDSLENAVAMPPSCDSSPVISFSKT